MNKHSVAVIGGGAAGCFAAAQLAEKGISVLVIERNDRLMMKLGITGKGRCNLTNDSDSATVMKNLPRNPRFMYSALSEFATSNTMAYFESLGVPLKTERGQRVFPVSDKASDIVSALKERMTKCGVDVVTARVQSVVKDDNGFRIKCGKSTYAADSVILATGGKSYPTTGSTGDGYAIAASFSHTITPIKPSLVPIVTKENCAEMMGLSLKNVKLTLTDRKGKGKKPIFSELGELLFTHFGISGPLVLSASSYIQSDEPERYGISIDLKPALDEPTLDKRIQRDFAERINCEFRNSLRGLLPEKLVKSVIERSGIDPAKRVNEITREERLRLLSVLKSFTLTFNGLRPVEEAIITDGGVDVREINPATMESKKTQGLYFAGEIIDVTGFTGGFNLQVAFSTAYAAANAIAKRIGGAADDKA